MPHITGSDRARSRADRALSFTVTFAPGALLGEDFDAAHHRQIYASLGELDRNIAGGDAYGKRLINGPERPGCSNGVEVVQHDGAVYENIEKPLALGRK